MHVCFKYTDNLIMLKIDLLYKRRQNNIFTVKTFVLTKNKLYINHMMVLEL